MAYIFSKGCHNYLNKLFYKISLIYNEIGSTYIEENISKFIFTSFFKKKV